MSDTTKYLNLDDLETESELTIRHEGKEYRMRTLTVEMFVAQQRRAADMERRSREAAAKGEEVGEDDMGSVVELLRDSVSEYFPGLPVNDLPVQKLFIIFGWLNELSSKINDIASEGATDTAADEGDVGNAAPEKS